MPASHPPIRDGRHSETAISISEADCHMQIKLLISAGVLITFVGSAAITQMVFYFVLPPI
jgi:hypothetical protein